MNVIQAIRSRRKAMKITQAELADQCGISRTQLVNIENEVSDTSFHRLELLAKALDCKIVMVPNTDESGHLAQMLEQAQREKTELVKLSTSLTNKLLALLTDK